MKDKNQTFTFLYTRQEHKDAGMACVLLMLILGWFTGNNNWFFAAIPVLFVAMVFPAACYPFSLVWYTLSLLLGNIMSKVILSMIFFLLVVPVGLIRRMAGKDPLKLSESGISRDSAFIVRNKRFSATDLSKPY
jgi:hypothetical protein